MGSATPHSAPKRRSADKGKTATRDRPNLIVSPSKTLGSTFGSTAGGGGSAGGSVAGSTLGRTTLTATSMEGQAHLLSSIYGNWGSMPAAAIPVSRDHGLCTAHERMDVPIGGRRTVRTAQTGLHERKAHTDVHNMYSGTQCVTPGPGSYEIEEHDGFGMDRFRRGGYRVAGKKRTGRVIVKRVASAGDLDSVGTMGYSRRPCLMPRAAHKHDYREVR